MEPLEKHMNTRDGLSAHINSVMSIMLFMCWEGVVNE